MKHYILCLIQYLKCRLARSRTAKYPIDQSHLLLVHRARGCFCLRLPPYLGIPWPPPWHTSKCFCEHVSATVGLNMLYLHYNSLPSPVSAPTVHCVQCTAEGFNVLCISGLFCAYCTAVGLVSAPTCRIWAFRTAGDAAKGLIVCVPTVRRWASS